MEEKKLTDKEIVESLKHCGSQHHIYGCKDCPMRDIKDCSDVPLHDNALDLIHRLQSEIEMQRKIIEYQDSVEDRNAELQKQVDEQDKEIDRLEKVVREQAEQYYDCEQRTAKEIITMIGGTCASMNTYLCSIIAKRYGVEVE